MARRVHRIGQLFAQFVSFASAAEIYVEKEKDRIRNLDTEKKEKIPSAEM